ncbi:TolC family outer membrane protein [Citrobacter rodentium NBRC 105723 = DSM 16636]|jgi:type I secretion outer membrane protein, TolC family|nr:CyaE [Citrobacter rodentium]QBY32104.1 type I secretion system outer membrane protein [Citrobacter rodentium]UHO31591.1 TolC family outer membrane protein [Citrobacter rodentium NBRC 105723 = DSM 16636]
MRFVFSMVTLLLSFGVASVPCFAALASIEETNLKESILFALDRDPDISSQAAQMGIGQAMMKEAKSGWMPQIGLTASAGHSQTTDSSGSLNNSAAWGITVTQLVYDFGKTNSAIAQSEAQYESYRYQLMATFSEVASKAAQGYVEVKRYSALTSAARENIVALEKIQHLAQLRASAGLSSTSDDLQTQTRIAGMRATLEQYDAALQKAKAVLAVQTGVSASRYASLPENLEVQQVSVENIDYSKIPAVLSARAMVTSAQHGVDRAKAQHLPTLSLKAGRTRYESDNRGYWDDQIQLSVDAPLYQGGVVSARVEQAQGAKAMAVSEVEKARYDILQKASAAMADWKGARGREDAGKFQLVNAIQTRSVYKNEYTLSKKTINDLLSVEQDVWQAESSRINAEYDGWSAAIQYATALDNLLPLIGIEKQASKKLPDL